MHGNGSGETHEGNGDDTSPRVTFEEALAAIGPARDRVDRIAIFAAQTSNDLLYALQRTLDLSATFILALSERLANAEAEIAELKGTPRASSRSNGGNGAGHGNEGGDLQ